MPKHISKETKCKIVKRYKEHPMTLEMLSSEFGISIPSVIKILDEYRIKRYSKTQLFSPNLYENFFEIIDSEEKAYFLGLIISDGCVHSTKGKQALIGLSLKEKDSYILEKFKQAVRSNKVITKDGRGCCELQILSNKMCQDLRKYGVIENKSLKTVFPKNLSKEMYPHLIRGLIDGDGSISYYVRKNRKSHTKAIRFCQGNKSFITDLMNFLKSEIAVEPVSIYQEKENLYSIAYRKNSSLISLIDYLYNDSTIYLDRKKRLCDLVYSEASAYGNTEITRECKSPLVS